MKPYSEFEIRQKIKTGFGKIETGQIDTVIGKLKELKYLNDAQFAEDYINYRTSISPRGKFLLKQELFKKGISAELIQTSLEKADLDESKLAKQLAEHKLKMLQNYEPKKKKEKLTHFLQNRGFGYAIIKECI